MSKQVVLITGALTGIGRATAMAFAVAGADVVVAGRREEDGKILEKELRELGAEAKFVKVDVRHEAELQSLVDETVKRFGRLDVAVNNAGTEGAKGPVTSQSPETYASTFDTNVLGVLLSMKHELRVMLPQGKGSIINVSSTLGHEGVAGHALYVASKHAVEGLTKSAALEVAGTGVRVNIVAPGPVDTVCSTDSPALRKRKPHWPAGFRSGELASPARLRPPWNFSLQTEPRSSPGTPCLSMAASSLVGLLPNDDRVRLITLAAATPEA
jgi:NAD(P)-dependent dehydrogenase (short-subunit alcohol dehydrogenase family)